MHLFSKNELPVSLFEQLTYFESELLFFLIRRKFVARNSKLSQTDFLKPSFVKIQELLDSFLPKKTEECYKFLMARTLNHIKEELESSMDTKVSLERFYEVYFEETARKHQMPVKEFHYPLTKDLKGKINLNYSYFGKVFKCQKFLRDVEVFFEHQIFANHMEEIYKKLFLLVLKWEKMYLKQQLMQEVSEKQLLDEVTSRLRYKIPWTCEELVQAIAKFRKLVNVCQEKEEREERGRVKK